MISQSNNLDASMFYNTFYYGSIGICLIKPMSSWFKINPSFCHIVGYSENELMKISCEEITHPEDKDIVNHYTERPLNRELETFQIEKRYIHKNGNIIWALVNVSLVRDQEGPQYLVIQVQDITERKFAERKLLDREQRYASLLTYSTVGIFSIDLSGKFIEVSPSYEEMTGYSSDELFSMTYRDILYPEVRDFGETNFRKAINGDLPHIELSLQHKNGSRIDVIASSSPIIISGETVGVFVITKDVANQKQTEERLIKAEKLSLVGELAAGIAHEIRNPLTSIRGFVQLDQSEDVDNKRKLRNEVMLSEIDRINEIVSELLVLAKPTNETYEL